MIAPDEIGTIHPFSLLSEPLRTRLALRAADLRAGAGETLVYTGGTAYYWTVLEGEVEVVQRVGFDERQITTFEVGESFGEVQLVLGAPQLADIRALTQVRLMRVDALDFHVMLAGGPKVQQFINETIARRVHYHSGVYLGIESTAAAIVGDRFDGRCHYLRDFLARNQIPYEWIDPSDPGELDMLPAVARDPERCPFVIMVSGRVLEKPKPRELAEALGLQTEPTSDIYDVAIVGGGPAGLAAAVYGGSEGLRTIMIEREAPGGQAGTSSRIENYLGFPSGIAGGELADLALKQAKRFGTEILVTRTVESIATLPNGLRCIDLDGGRQLSARALVVATGVTWRELDVVGAADLIGRGVYYGAARTEARAMGGKDVFLIGGGNSAGQAAMFLSNYARSVTIVVRGTDLAANMSHYLIRQLQSKKNVSVETQTVVSRVHGSKHLEGIETTNVASGEASTRGADGLFVFIGADPRTEWLPNAIERDSNGYLRTGRDVQAWRAERAPFPLETSVPGIFAAGDVRSESVKRVAAGVGEGSMVIAFIHQYLAGLNGDEKFRETSYDSDQQ